MVSIFALSPSGTRIVIDSFKLCLPRVTVIQLDLLCQLLLIVTISSDSMWYDSIKSKPKIHSNTQPELAEMKEKVLLYIAENGETNIYRIGEHCKIGYSTAHGSIKALEQQGLVQLMSARKNEKGVIAKSYGLTAKGLYYAIYKQSPWHEKIRVAEKSKDLLKPNVLEWLNFIETINDAHIEEAINNQISATLSYSDPLYFIDVIDDFFFATIIIPEMIIYHESYCKIMKIIQCYPRIKSILLKDLEEQIAWAKEDLRKQSIMQEEFEKLK